MNGGERGRDRGRGGREGGNGTRAKPGNQLVILKYHRL